MIRVNLKPSMKIYLLTNPAFVGDNNQLLGIQYAIQTHFNDEPCVFHLMKEADFKVDLLTQGDVVFVSGSHGLLLTQVIKQNNSTHQVFWSGHQYFAELRSIEHLPDLVALPQTALSDDQKRSLEEKTHLMITSGVAHCVHETTVEKDHTQFKGVLPDLLMFPQQVGIILAGDAPEPTGQMKYFTEEDAREQACQISRYLITRGYDQEDTAIMITNGPRTGKYSSDTGSVLSPDPHRSGQMDSVSKAFIEIFAKTIHYSKLFVYDFQFAALINSPSAYKPMIKQVTDSESGLWFVPSESTSMVTESSFLLEKGKQVVIYHPSSENSVHLAHVTETIAQGFALDIRHDEAFKLTQTPIKSTADQIAEACCSLLRKKIILNHRNSGLFGLKNPSGDPIALSEKRHDCGYSTHERVSSLKP